MKITIAYQDHEKAKATKDTEVIRQRHICSGDRVKIRESDRHKPYYHTYMHITIPDKPHK